jgi:hypothetical protein
MEYAEARHQLLLHGPGTTDATGQPLVRKWPNPRLREMYQRHMEKGGPA